MQERIYNVLFLCTGNSARSIMAEGLMNQLGRGRFKAWSAGSHPAGQVNPFALGVLEHYNLSLEGYRSKSWDEFAQTDAPVMDFVLTVCDNAAGEVCPIWPGQPMTAHWGVPDPAAVDGADEKKQRAFMDTAHILRRRIELLIALPLAKLDRLAIQREVKSIGEQNNTPITSSN